MIGMKKIFFAVVFIAASFAHTLNAQTPVPAAVKPDSVVENNQVQPAATEAVIENTVVPAEEEQQSFHQMLREKFIEGGAGWMAPILICLIIGLGLAIERILYLNMSTINSKKLIDQIETALNKGGVEDAKEVCRSTRGPLAGIFYEGLNRQEEGMDLVEKSIISYGSVVNGKLESNLTWIALFIALAPMLGFLGTVVGMVAAFDAIEAAGDISPAIVAGGIKVALLTTVFGLIVAMILQVLYNYIVAKIDAIVNNMEESVISFVDVLWKYQKKQGV